MKQKPRKDTVLLKAVAIKLRQLRKERGISQKNVFIDTDIHVGRIELGKQNITLSTLSILCDYYKIEIEEFFNGITVNSKDLWEQDFKIRNLKPTNPILVELIAKRMQDIRERHNHTKERVIHNTGLGISHYENKLKFPSLGSISKFCKYYNITLEEFFAGITYPPKEQQ